MSYRRVANVSNITDFGSVLMFELNSWVFCGKSTI